MLGKTYNILSGDPPHIIFLFLYYKVLQPKDLNASVKVTNLVTTKSATNVASFNKVNLELVV